MQFKPRASWLTIAALSLAAACLSGCGSEDDEPQAKRPDDPAQAELFDKATNEGAVYIYTNFEEAINDRIKTGYADAVGLPVTTEKVASTSLNSRFEAEAEAGAVRADLLVTDCEFITAQVSNGAITSMVDAGVPNYDTFPANFKLDGGAVAAIQTIAWGVGYNTDRVTSSEAPKTWDDLLDPRWEGKILMTTPENSSRVAFYDYLLNSRGAEFLSDLSAQVGQAYADTGSAVAALIAGEGEVILPTAGQVVGAGVREGAPLAFVLPDETTGAPLCVGLSTDAPNPNAARLFLSYLLSADGSEAVNGAEEYAASGPFGQGIELPSGYVAPPAVVTDEMTEQVVAALDRS